MKYLKKFQKQTDYQSFITGDTFVTPNVSFAKEENVVFYNPYEKEVISPNHIITYTASEKLTELGDNAEWSDSGVRINAFNTLIMSHEFVDGVGTITFEEDVTSIGEQAFYKCSGLTSINIPDAVTSIGNNAFSNCSSLTSIVIPDSVTSIGNNAFSNCSSLTSVTIGSGVTNIGYSAFYNCSGLTSVDIPDSVTSIGDGAFQYCSGLTEVTIGSGVTSIGDYTFQNCSGLTSIVIPDSVTSIGNDAFRYCSGLTSVTIGSGVTSIGNYTFQYCRSLTSINIPNSVTSIGDTAFNNCRSLTSIDIPDSVTSIGYSAFYNCSGLTEVTIGSGVTSIGDSAFQNCSGLTSIVIPDSVTSIGNSAFTSCSSLTSVVIPNSVTSIGGSAFNNCRSLTSIDIPDSVTSIGYSAFYNCSGLTEVTIGSGVTSIGNNAFTGCNSLPVENNVRYADTYLVKAVDSTQSTYTIKEGTKWIGSYAFSGNFFLTSIVIPDSVTSIGNNAFYTCSRLTSIEIPDSVTSIGEDAFNYCSGLTSIVIPDSVTSIGNNAFAYCSGLTEITCHALTAPSITSNTFYYIKSNGVLYYPVGSDYSNWLSTNSYYLGYYNWTWQELYTPTTYYNLTITADDVNGRKTNTTIHWTCISDGYNPVDGTPVTGFQLTGTSVSAEFPQNTSETDTVERTITFEYQGLTASTVITQGVWINQSYTVDLNNQWQLSTGIANPDSTVYDGVYESFSNKGVDESAALMYIDIVGYTDFSFYVRSDAESDYDYVVVSNLDCTLDSETTSGDNVKMTTSGNQTSGTAISNYQLVEFTGIDGAEHRITVMYRKDSSSASGTDQGYVLIPKE